MSGKDSNYDGGKAGKIGKDSDYAGGESLRRVDHALQNCGLSRDSSIIKAGHAIEHTRRGIIANWDGDHDRAHAEFQRAKSNFSYERSEAED
ncbi:hypothetical protein ENUP19_0089G0008 [Entamoeba nuttalli]|uniref:Uncharacterized protein n=1 Tax=Entamoeba nuttalli TaxID=412467 RepID=A0ABQ0DGZ2_9EUKA